MQHESKLVVSGDPGTERILLFALLRSGRPAQWSRLELERELYDVAPDVIRGSLVALGAIGVVSLDGEQVQASPAVRRIDALDMICI
jgi:hypothetical protein